MEEERTLRVMASQEWDRVGCKGMRIFSVLKIGTKKR